MIPLKIKGHTHVLGAPGNWDEKNGPCVGLAVRVQPYGDTIITESAWEPIPDELAAINKRDLYTLVP